MTDSFFTSSSHELFPDEPYLLFDPELESCLKIIQKPVSLRTVEDNENLVKKIITLDIFKKSILDNLDEKTVLSKLAPFMQYEFYPANSLLCDYDAPVDKFNMILSGRAKEFMPKTIQELEKEVKNYSKKSDGKRPSSNESGAPTSLTSVVREEENCSQIPTMTTLPDKESIHPVTETYKEKFAKINTLLPSLKRFSIQKYKSENLDEDQSERVLRKIHPIIKSLNLDGVLEAGFIEKQVDDVVLREFKKNEKNYFLGGIFKLKFSRFLCPGDHCGLNNLKGDTLGTKAVIATEDCYCLSIPKEDFIMVIENEKELNRDKIEFFQRMFGERFHRLSIMEFALLWETQVYQLNQVIFQQEDPADTLHALVTGEVVISKSLDTALKKLPTNQELPLRVKKRHDSNEHLLKLVTKCGGNFFGEEDFFSGNPRQFTATVSSTRAKVFKLSMQKFQAAYRDYRDIIAEIEGRINAKKTWQKERLDYLAQQRDASQQQPEVSSAKKKQVIQIEQSSARNAPVVDALPKKIKVVKKENFNIRFHYDKYFVPKPDKGYPGFYDAIKESKAGTPLQKGNNGKCLNFMNLKSEEFESSIEDQKSDLLPSVSQVELRGFHSDLAKKKDENNFQQTMKKILDSHFSGSKRCGAHENPLKISTRILATDEDYIGRHNNMSKGTPTDMPRSEQELGIKSQTPISFSRFTRQFSKALPASKGPIMELMQLLPLSVRTSVQPGTGTNHTATYNEPLRITSLKGTRALKIETTKAAAPVDLTKKNSLKVAQVSRGAENGGVKSEQVADKENGLNIVKIGTISQKPKAKVLLTKSKSGYIKSL